MPYTCWLPNELIVRRQNISTLFQIFNTSNKIKSSHQCLCYDFMSGEKGEIASK